MMIINYYFPYPNVEAAGIDLVESDEAEFTPSTFASGIRSNQTLTLLVSAGTDEQVCNGERRTDFRINTCSLHKSGALLLQEKDRLTFDESLQNTRQQQLNLNYNNNSNNSNAVEAPLDDFAGYDNNNLDDDDDDMIADSCPVIPLGSAPEGMLNGQHLLLSSDAEHEPNNVFNSSFAKRFGTPNQHATGSSSGSSSLNTSTASLPFGTANNNNNNNQNMLASARKKQQQLRKTRRDEEYDWKLLDPHETPSSNIYTDKPFRKGISYRIRLSNLSIYLSNLFNLSPSRRYH